MALTLRIDNFAPANLSEGSALDADTAVSASPIAVLVKNSVGFTLNGPVLVGNLGSETAELRYVTLIGDATHVTLNSLAYVHNRFDPITSLIGDQIQLYRAPNVDGGVPADISFAVVGSPQGLNADGLSTDISDPTGGSSYWYKYTYRNSVTTIETSLADAIAERGGTYGHYVSIGAIRYEAGFANNVNIKDTTIAECRNEAESTINSRLHGFFTLPLTEPVAGNVSRMTKMLAAGYLLNREYGAMNTGGTSAQGQAKINEVLGTKDMPGSLAELIDGTTTIVGTNDTDLSTSNQVSYYPDDSEDAGDFKFTMDDVY